MSHLQKWRRWCRRIEEDILIPYKYDMLVAEEYFRIIDPILKTGQPAVFHNWCTLNYGKCLCLVLRKLCDSDHRVYSIRKLVGDIDQNSNKIKRETYLRRYPAHLRDLGVRHWQTNVSHHENRLPRSIPHNHIEEIKIISKKYVDYTNKFVTHRERTKATRFDISFDDIYLCIRRMISIGHFYADLVGGSIPDDDQNVVYTFDWQSVFSVKWLNDKEHKLYG